MRDDVAEFYRCSSCYNYRFSLSSYPFRSPSFTTPRIFRSLSSTPLSRIVPLLTYRTLGTRIERLEDQDENDLDKSVSFLKGRIDADIVDCTPPPQEEQHNTPPYSVDPDLDPVHESSLVVLGAFGGRMDQQMSVLSSLVRWQGVFGRVVLLGEGNCSYLLDKHVIRLIDDDVLIEGLTCGLIPINGPVDGITTEGLAWNLLNNRLEMGVRISSSNCLQAGLQPSTYRSSRSSRQVTVETGGKLLWTHEWKFKTAPNS